MSGDFVEIPLSIPIDSDGFVRRACPTCEREFKWFASGAGGSGAAGDADEEDAPATQRYFCPYCGVAAPPDCWWTTAQLEFAQATAAAQVFGPELEKLSSELNRSGGGLLSVRLEGDLPESPEPLSETDDMRQVTLACHPGEPVKVLEDWTADLYCLVCGERRIF